LFYHTGFPTTCRAFDDVVPSLTDRGARVFRPYLSGHGLTRFLSAATARSGQQAALGSDLLGLLDALDLDTVILCGYDWGDLSSCVVSALWPHRVAGLVTVAGYDIFNIDQQRQPQRPGVEHAVWYQHLFQTERGRSVLTSFRADLCRMLWTQWSPQWRIGWLNDPSSPCPRSPSTGRATPWKPGGTADHASMFTGQHEHRVIDAGHALPYEAPAAFSDAILTVHDWNRTS